MDNNYSYAAKVKKVFGPSILDERGNIDRIKLGRLIFDDPIKRKQLNKMSHPLIFKSIFFELIKLKLFQRK